MRNKLLLFPWGLTPKMKVIHWHFIWERGGWGAERPRDRWTDREREREREGGHSETNIQHFLPDCYLKHLFWLGENVIYSSFMCLGEGPHESCGFLYNLSGYYVDPRVCHFVATSSMCPCLLVASKLSSVRHWLEGEWKLLSIGGCIQQKAPTSVHVIEDAELLDLIVIWACNFRFRLRLSSQKDQDCFLSWTIPFSNNTNHESWRLQKPPF